jgi:hypothetical protein
VSDAHADPVPPGHEFALLLTHDVDRPYKTYQSIYYAVTERDPSHLASLLPGVDPYWQFENITALEEDLGVRSAFYFLDEQRLLRDRPLCDLLSPTAWRLYAGRYDPAAPPFPELIRRLDAGGWEVGLHGSYESYRDATRLRREKDGLEATLGHELTGGRQHYLNLERPATWRRQADVGLRYDASLGSSSTVGFQHGTGVLRPFDDEFVVFPLTVMENALPDPGDRPEEAWAVCRDLLDEAAATGAVMTVLWHPRCFSVRDFPGYLPLYRRLVERSTAAPGWVRRPTSIASSTTRRRQPGVTRTPHAAPGRRKPEDNNTLHPPGWWQYP